MFIIVLWNLQLDIHSVLVLHQFSHVHLRELIMAAYSFHITMFGVNKSVYNFNEPLAIFDIAVKLDEMHLSKSI